MIDDIEEKLRTIYTNYSNRILQNTGKGSSSSEITFSTKVKGDDDCEYQVIIGVDEESDGVQLDYIYKRYMLEETNDYIFSNGNWSQLQELVDFLYDFMLLLKKAEKSELITENELTNFQIKMAEIKKELYEERRAISIEYINTLINEKEYEQIQNIIGFSEDNRRDIWKLFYSKKEDENIENKILNQKMLEKNGKKMLFIETERFYQDSRKCKNGRKYPFRVIIGEEDSMYGFFMHRLKNTRAKDGPKTVREIQDRLGYSKVYESTKKVAINEKTLFCNNLIFERKSAEKIKNKFTDKLTKNMIGIRLVKEDIFSTIIPDDIKQEFVRLGLEIKNSNISTDELKELQDELNISEEQVRKEQQIRGFSRLSANRRAEIIEDIIFEEATNKALEENIISLVEVKKDVENKIQDIFNNHEINSLYHKNFKFIFPEKNVIRVNIHTNVNWKNMRDFNTEPSKDSKFKLYPTNKKIINVKDKCNIYVYSERYGERRITLPGDIYFIEEINSYSKEHWM